MTENTASFDLTVSGNIGGLPKMVAAIAGDHPPKIEAALYAEGSDNTAYLIGSAIDLIHGLLGAAKPTDLGSIRSAGPHLHFEFRDIDAVHDAVGDTDEDDQ